MTTLSDFTLPGLHGEPIRFADFSGRPVLVVNTASLCGFTGQYAGLQTLWESFRGRGLAVVAVPSNDFGRQEPGDAAAIGAVCDGRFRVGFPVAAKAPVKGDGATPLFRWLAAEAGWAGRPRWNFYKYLLGRDGRLAAWFGSVTRPDGARLRRAVEHALDAPRDVR